jgi:hypothetical protein
LEITFRTVASYSHEIIRTVHSILLESEKYDLIFVDPFHTYRAGLTDLLGAFCILKPDGIIVVHDCNPRDPDIVQPVFQEGLWCGVTYEAFIDFALAESHSAYCTVDTDHGCGVVFKNSHNAPAELRETLISDRIRLEWTLLKSEDQSRFHFFDTHRKQLLNLIAPDRFKALIGESDPASGSTVS